MVDVIPLSFVVRQMLLPLYTLAEVMINVWQIYFNHCRLVLLPFVFCLGDSNLRLMLLPLFNMADVIAMWQMLCHLGVALRLMLLPLIGMADVIANIVYS